MRQAFRIIIGLYCSWSFGYAQTIPDSAETNLGRVRNGVTVDAVFLLLGAVSPGAELSVTDDISLIGDITFGDMLFVKINTMYGLGFRYYFSDRRIRGMNVSTSFYSTEVEYRQKKAVASGILLMGGYKWLLSRFIAMDVSAGMNITSSPKVIFDETSGSLTKSVSIGGTGFTVNARIGVGW